MSEVEDLPCDLTREEVEQRAADLASARPGSRGSHEKPHDDEG